MTSDKRAFCSGPFLHAWRFSPCMLDLVVSSLLLCFIAIFVSIWIIKLLKAVKTVTDIDHHESSIHDEHSTLHNTAHSDDMITTANQLGLSEQDPLLSSNIRPSVQSLTLWPITRALVLIVFLFVIADMLIDFYAITHPDSISVISNHKSARTLADVLLAFSWLIATVSLFFASTCDYRSLESRSESAGISCANLSPAFLIHFWAIAFGLELVRAYNWVAFLIAPSSDSPLNHGIDVATLCIFIGRLLLVALLLGIALVYRQPKLEPVVHSTQLPKQRGWFELIGRLRKLFPFLWPQETYLRFLVVVCFTLLILGRVVNILVPETYKRLVNALTLSTESHNFIPDGLANQVSDHPYFAWGLVLLYTFFRFLQGNVGLLMSLQSLLWIPVGQSTSRQTSVKMLAHLHSLSLQFHISRKTGDLLRVVDRGTTSISSLLSYIIFNIFPVFVDIGLAVIYFAFTFEMSIAIIVLVTMVLYIAVTIWITEWRTQFRREMNDLDGASRARAVDSLLNFETVKYFGNEAWEVNEYDQAIRMYQNADWRSNASLNLLNTAQNIVITLGLFAGLMVCAGRVVDGALSVGDFVAFIAYLLQLYQPLNWFGTYYRVIQQNFIDMEKMLELFDIDQAVEDSANATVLDVSHGGAVEFKNVSYAYTADTPILNNVSFSVPFGKTVALVGPSGGGKSTVLRLLFRFDDVKQGSICIDGQDIRHVTQVSLRQQIGVVPQDTVLFNDTILYNIRYGKIDATDEEVFAAAKAAQIHDRILSFPKGYDTKVGERGLRLSGGEKQRVAIARTMLKHPCIMLLDEATSALDNQTERQVQESLHLLRSQGKMTMLVVAHRLSTIVDADQILVIKNGQVVERGTHEELIHAGETLKHSVDSIVSVENGVGTYYGMWTREIEESKTPNTTQQELTAQNQVRVDQPATGSRHGHHH
ncbi:hypothetical protein BDV3_003023 [Batrachochytrium dendrobatidis]